MRRARGLFAASAVLALSACANGTSATPAAHDAAPVVASSTPVTAPAPVQRHTRRAKPPPPPPPTRTSTSAKAHPSLLVEHLAGVGSARQVVSVTATGYGTSYAMLAAFSRTAHGWKQVFGPWPARIGYAGFAPPQQKREGDGRTPTGSFGVQFMFGVEPDPGVRYRYRPVLATSWWDDDPASTHYNQWVDSRSGNPGRDPEPMRQVPAYRYGAVIGYNTARTPGLGSAIFLHVAHTGATTGCVSLPEAQLLSVLEWLDPAAHPRIVMGTAPAVVR